jgi:ATP-dependent protease HslVU (ClpYQ) peptidase subunit
MTTIAVNKESIAGDKQFTYGGSIKMLGKTKIYEVPAETAKAVFGCNKVLVGFCGNAMPIDRAVKWLWEPTTKPPKLKNMEVVMLTDKKEIYHGNDFRSLLKVEDKFMAIGSGMQYALAAMHSGKTPLEAVKIASKFDTMTGMGFNEIKL